MKVIINFKFITLLKEVIHHKTYNHTHKMAEYDYFNQLKGKVQELRLRRDEINSDVMQ